MKTFLPATVLFAGLLIITTLNISCKKTEVGNLAPKEDLVLGKWNVNRMQLKIFSNGVFVKDTIIKQTPHPENFVNFDANGAFEYRFNATTSDIGTYQFVGADSVYGTTSGKIYKWKMLTLTKDIFTVVTSSNYDPYYPGAFTQYPGSIIENYQTFVRYK